jgi:hypothetical protein
MGFTDGATSEQRRLANAAGVTLAVARTKSGADLEFARLTREAGGATQLTGMDLAQRATSRASVHGSGESTYAAAGGKVTRIFGEGFTGATAVNFGATPGTDFSVLSDEIIEVTTPAKAAATYDLTVVHPDGNGTLTNGVVFV